MPVINGTQVPLMPIFQTPVPTVDSIVGLYGKTDVADANYAATNADNFINYTSLTAPRSMSLPLASSYPPDKPFVVCDGSGQCSAANSITILPTGADTIANQTSVKIASPNQTMVFYSNGSNLWTF